MPLSTVFFSSEPLPLHSVVYIISVYLLHVINFYIGYFLLLPLLLRKKKIILTIFGSFSFVLLFAVLRWVFIKNLFNLIQIELDQEMTRFLGNNLAMMFEYTVQSFVFTAFAFLLRSTLEWFNDQKQRSELLNQNQASELALLRYQINPHFLFNTLNNIYALVYKKDEKAPGAVMKLSEILHYTLYKSNVERVQLDNEIVCLRSFIELQSLRVSDPNFVSFTVEGDANGKTIVPMLLLPFVENAFKHCQKEVQSPGIIINILINDDFIEFRCKNFVSENNQAYKDEVGGIGLQNIKRRIELLYDKMHKLEIVKTEQEFNVYLKLYNK
jgi:LytS/YehU family sensor histidine kinase